MDLVTLATGWSNLLLGAVYVSYGLITLAELRRETPTRGTSHVGWAWVAMAFTCGPHHVEHGLHLLTSPQAAGLLDLGVVAVGYPAAIIWFWLRMHALRGGPGDRIIRSDLPVDLLRTSLAGSAVLVAAGLLAMPTLVGAPPAAVLSLRLLPNALLVVLYTALGVVLVRTQLRRNAVEGTWSLSGLSMATIFPTCAAMHAVWFGYVATGAYVPDLHLLVTDLVGVPAAAYFLAVMWLVSEGRLTDWAGPARDASAPLPLEEQPATPEPARTV